MIRSFQYNGLRTLAFWLIFAALTVSGCVVLIYGQGIRTGAYALNAADAVDAACPPGNPAAQAARDAESDMRADFVSLGTRAGTPGINSAYAAAQAAWAAAERCGYTQPRIPDRPGYKETFWAISS